MESHAVTQYFTTEDTEGAEAFECGNRNVEGGNIRQREMNADVEMRINNKQNGKKYR